MENNKQEKYSEEDLDKRAEIVKMRLLNLTLTALILALIALVILLFRSMDAV